MDLTSRLWQFCNKLRHDGVDSADYIEQLTYLLFLKMAKEKGVSVPEKFDWESLVTKNKSALLKHLESILQHLKKESGILGDIFSEPVSRVRNVDILDSLIGEINSYNWTAVDADVVGLAFEELIGKVANDGKKGAGQYFTPRPLINAIVEVMKPSPLEKKDFKIGDVASGTAGFLIVAYEWFKKQKISLSKQQSIKILNNTYYGQELVQRPRRLALMNMFLHGINAKIKLGDTIYDSPDEIFFDCILTNPPFGTKGANQIPNRSFPIKTSDKQLNFIQHVIERLNNNGRAAIVLPDSCLSNDTARKIWSFYLDKSKSLRNVCNLHTVLKLPEGIFAAYANGVKACVIFLQKGDVTEKMWIYDARKNFQKITTKSNSLNSQHFNEFVDYYGKDSNGKSRRIENERFRAYSLTEIIGKGYDLSFVESHKPRELAHPTFLIDEMIADYKKKILVLQKLKKNLPRK